MRVLENSISFFKVMRIVTIGHIFVSLLIVTVCVTQEIFYNTYQCFFLARFFYSCLMGITIILPAIYLFGIYPESKHILISAYIIFATFLGKLLAYLMVKFTINSSTQVWYWLPVLISFISLRIYVYLEKHQQHSTGKEKPNRYLRPHVHKKILAMAIGAACNIGIAYHYYFLEPYIADIVIVKDYGLISGESPFYISFGLFLLPAVKICKKFGVLETMVASLIWIFILGASLPFIGIFDHFYIGYQILFAFFLANFTAPSLAMVYQLFKNSGDIFDSVFWFTLGSSIAMLLLCVGSRIGFSTNTPLVGLFVFAVVILLSLVGIRACSLFKKIPEPKPEQIPV